jgi:hypothetical protein
MSRSDPPDDPYDDDSSGPPPGPNRYDEVPLLRRNGFCSGVLVAHVGVMFLGGCVPLVSLLGIFTTIGVILVCFVVLTGPVYYDKRNKDGTLKTWGKGNKVAAVILLLLFVGGYAALLYFLVSSGKFG